MSGGVIVAAKIKITIIEWRRYFLRNSGVTSPALLKKYIKTGSSKVNPAASVTDVMVPM